MKDEKICIPHINNGEPFSIPKKTMKNKIDYLEKMSSLKISEKLKENQEYMAALENQWLTYYVLKNKFSDLKPEDVELIEEDLLYKIGRIIRGVDEEQYQRTIDNIKERMFKKYASGNINFQMGEELPKKKK